MPPLKLCRHILRAHRTLGKVVVVETSEVGQGIPDCAVRMIRSTTTTDYERRSIIPSMHSFGSTVQLMIRVVSTSKNKNCTLKGSIAPDTAREGATFGMKSTAGIIQGSARGHVPCPVCSIPTPYAVDRHGSSDERMNAISRIMSPNEETYRFQITRCTMDRLHASSKSITTGAKAVDL